MPRSAQRRAAPQSAACPSPPPPPLRAAAPPDPPPPPPRTPPQANNPWSGFYEVGAPLWALAHTYSQFNPAGWRYAQHFWGVELLRGGGSVVTRISPDRRDFTIVIEKVKGGEQSACARGNNPETEAEAEQLTLQLRGSFAAALAGGVRRLQVWHSDLTDNSTELPMRYKNPSPPYSRLFNRRPPIAVGADGRLALTVRPNET